MKSTWCIIVAAGSGSRFGGAKQFGEINGRRVIDLSIACFVNRVDGVVVVVDPKKLEGVELPVNHVVPGGATRSESVRNGLALVPETADFVLVHDAARPLVSGVVIDRVLSALDEGSAAVVPVVELRDSLRSVSGSSVDRSEFVCVQTPQGFDAKILRRAYLSGAEASDDATLVESLGCEVDHVDGDHNNIKVTYPVDLKVCEAIDEFE